MKEKWKKIPRAEGYEVSNFGNVRSYKNRWWLRIEPRILRQNFDRRKYYQVILVDNNGKRITRWTHKLVARAFIPNPKDKRTVNHKNGIKTDNRTENLEWMSDKEQTYHSYHILGRKGSCTWRLWANWVRAKKIIQKDLKWNIIKIWDYVTEPRKYWFTWNISCVCKWKRKTVNWYKREYLSSI